MGAATSFLEEAFEAVATLVRKGSRPRPTRNASTLPLDSMFPLCSVGSTSPPRPQLVPQVGSASPQVGANPLWPGSCGASARRCNSPSSWGCERGWRSSAAAAAQNVVSMTRRMRRVSTRRSNSSSSVMIRACMVQIRIGKRRTNDSCTSCLR
jgi:hypothetical protein